jgi:hypothetical protein
LEKEVKASAFLKLSDAKNTLLQETAQTGIAIAILGNRDFASHNGIIFRVFYSFGWSILF